MNPEPTHSARVSNSAVVSSRAHISDRATVWEFSQIRENSRIGENTIIGSYVYIDADVVIGKNCKVQNGALLYSPAEISDNVFIGPGVILTNDHLPRSVNPNGSIKIDSDWVKTGVRIEEGASLGAGSICIAPVIVGKWAMVGAGAVVTKDVQNFALVIGNPARRVAWVGKSGNRLEKITKNRFRCPKTLEIYELTAKLGAAEELVQV